ncbi:MAG: pilin [Candidatus Moraniibacteriota bacterium]
MGNQIVTCSGLDCSVCTVLAMVSAAFHYLLDISAVLAILLIIVAGFLYILGRGDEVKQEQAKRILVYAIFGFALSLLSFIIVLSIYLFSGAKNTDGWYKIDCSADRATSSESQIPENIADTSYLENKADQIVTSGSINSIVTGDKKIVKLDPSKIDPINIASDIQSLDPDRTINFVAADKDLSGSQVIDFRNIDSGFEKDKAAEFQIMKKEESTDKIVDPKEKISQILSITTSDVKDDVSIEPGSDLEKYLGENFNTDQQGLEKIATGLKKVAQVSDLGGKDLYAYVTGSPVVKGTRDENCYDSGGEITEFPNACFADQERYENRNIQCSSLHKPVTGCDCPGGYYLKGEKCISANTLKKEETEKDKKQGSAQSVSCKDVSLETHNCPISRCEGDKMMIYPISVQDQCLDSLNGPQVSKKSCVGTLSANASENQKCTELFNQKSDQEKMKEAEDFYNKYKQSPDWYDKILEKEFSKGSDVQQGGSKGTGPSDTGSKGTGDTGSKDTGSTDTGSKDTGTKEDTGTLPSDKGAGNFNPTPSFEELKECIGLPGNQIPYNGILVVLLNPANFDRSDKYLVNNNDENVSRMFYLTRKGEILGKNGQDLGKTPMAGGQEYGARDFKKGTSRDSMWGRGWKIFKGPTKYIKANSGWTDHCSFGTQEYGSKGGYKIGDYTRNDQGNLGGGTRTDKKGRVSEDVHGLSGCGQHMGKKGSSAGCATMGNNSRCGFIDKAKEYMTMSEGTVMQIHLKGEMDPVSGKFKSPDCGKIDYCAAKKSFQNSAARKFRNDPNEGYDPNKEDDKKRMVNC